MFRNKATNFLVTGSLAIFLSSCLETSVQGTADSLKTEVPGCDSNGRSDEKNPHCKKAKPSVKNISLNGDVFVVEGSNLNNISEMRIQIENSIIKLSIDRKSETELIAKPQSSLALVAGAVYKLLVSQAHADSDDGGSDDSESGEQVIPVTISVTLPSLEVSAKCESKSSSLAFMGYTDLTNAGIGGLKGGNDLCHSNYPGSHWASVDEVMKLGSSYPWTQPIWIRDLRTDEYGNGGSYICGGFRYGKSYPGSVCTKDPELSNVSVGSGVPSLSTRGIQKYSCCEALRALACVK